jgi:hypothetical protein
MRDGRGLDRGVTLRAQPGVLAFHQPERDALAPPRATHGAEPAVVTVLGDGITQLEADELPITGGVHTSVRHLLQTPHDLLAFYVAEDLVGELVKLVHEGVTVRGEDGVVVDHAPRSVAAGAVWNSPRVPETRRDL